WSSAGSSAARLLLPMSPLTVSSVGPADAAGAAFERVTGRRPAARPAVVIKRRLFIPVSSLVVGSASYECRAAYEVWQAHADSLWPSRSVTRAAAHPPHSGAPLAAPHPPGHARAHPLRLF